MLKNTSNGQTNTGMSEKVKRLPSLRQNQDENDQFKLFKASQQFQSNVAEALGKDLDKKLAKLLKEPCSTSVEQRKHKKRKGGVKLLRTSNKFLTLNEHMTNLTPKVIKREVKSCLPSEEDIKSVAISPEEILSQKEVKKWSNRSKAKVYNYKKNKSGSLVLVE